MTRSTSTATARSSDGTQLAFETIGNGPPVVLIGGAFNDRHAKAAGTPLAKLLARDCTVTSYDRRGRGDSADTPIAPGAVLDRELEDLAAVIAAVGGRASLFGMSSGGLLALAATTRGLPVDKLAIYEAPIVVDDGRASTALASELRGLVASGDRGGAAALFLTRGVRIPPPVVVNMRRTPMWPALEALAHTLAYDAEITAKAMALVEAARDIRVSSVVLAGTSSPAFLIDGMKLLACALPNATLGMLDGQTHDVDPAVLAAALISGLRA